MRYTANTFIYKFIIDPLLSGGRAAVLNELEEGDRVLDIASGTGALAMAASDKASYVLGIDLDGEKIQLARDTAQKRNMQHIEFALMDASNLSSFGKGQFDAAVISMAVHQFEPEVAVKILSEMKRVASKVIILDYSFPLPSTLMRSVVFIIERIAGGDHYRNFRKYISRGGLDHFTGATGLIKKKPAIAAGRGVFNIVVCT